MRKLLAVAFAIAVPGCGGNSSPTAPASVVTTTTLPAIWTVSGMGDNVVDIPTRVTRVRVQGSYGGFCQNFVIWIGNRLLVNEILGACSVGTGSTFDGTYLLSVGGGTARIEGSSGISWTFTEVR